MIVSNSVEAGKNLLALSQNSYPGRGMVIGMDEIGHVIQVYWIMGRSENSRNRKFSVEGGRVFTQPIDPAKVKDPSLIIYNAMRDSHGHFVVSNGVQTDDVVLGVSVGNNFARALRRWPYEPDAPNFTPRITGIYSLAVDHGDPPFYLSIIRKAAGQEDSCDRTTYEYEKFEKGFGRCITTYVGDGDPLPSFKGDPRLMPLTGDIDTIKGIYWEALDSDNKVALAVKRISPLGHTLVKVVNKYK